MTPLFQNDPRLERRPSIRTHGCYFRGLTQLVERHVGRALAEHQVIQQYDWLIKEDHMVDERGRQAFVLRPNEVGRAAQHYLHTPQTFRAVVRRSEPGYDEHDFDHGVEPMYWLALGYIEGGKIPHFWEVDADGNSLWDSLWPVRRKIRIISMRGFTL